MANNQYAQAKLAKTFRVGAETTSSAIRSFLSGIDTPRALTVWLLYSSNEHDQLVGLSIEPSDYLDPFSFRDDFLATSFLSKAEFLRCSHDRKKVALEKFTRMEDQCRSTNARFRRLGQEIIDPALASLLSATKRKISKILGDFSIEDVLSKAGWGPGVTTKLHGRDANPISKFRLENEATPKLCHLMGDLHKLAYPQWWDTCSFDENQECTRRFTPVSGNSIITVPKNSKTDRVIAVEPGLNLWYQKGTGAVIRERLRLAGVDLNTQVRNQQLARRGSIDHSLATVDFSSASDTISKCVIEELITDSRWLTWLSCLRSPQGVLKHDIIHWEKFSSMGNGYTFELESLVFYAAALAVCDHLRLPTTDVSVFGDDVILPTDAYRVYRQFCTFLGFTVNDEKSFFSGRFRESCGAYFFDGIDVKPIFLKKGLSNAKSLFKLANSIRNCAHRRNNYYGCDRKFLATWRYLYSRCPKSIRFQTSASIGDLGFSSNLDEACPSRANLHRKFGGFEGYRALALVADPIGLATDSRHLLTASVKSLGDDGVASISSDDWDTSIRSCRMINLQSRLDTLLIRPDLSRGNTYYVRDLTRTIVKMVLVSEWYNYGPWF